MDLSAVLFPTAADLLHEIAAVETKRLLDQVCALVGQSAGGLSAPDNNSPAEIIGLQKRPARLPTVIRRWVFDVEQIDCLRARRGVQRDLIADLRF
jgi:hypothetical protein